MGVGIGARVCATTLGGIACIFEVGLCIFYRNSSLVVFTLGVSVFSHGFADDGTGNLYIRFRLVAIYNSTLLVGSPASRLGVVGVGDTVRIFIIFSAACLKKLSLLTFGNVITFGKKVTISMSLTDFFLGKYTLIHL